VRFRKERATRQAPFSTTRRVAIGIGSARVPQFSCQFRFAVCGWVTVPEPFEPHPADENGETDDEEQGGSKPSPCRNRRSLALPSLRIEWRPPADATDDGLSVPSLYRLPFAQVELGQDPSLVREKSRRPRFSASREKG
jgi:hypothetical protein